MNRRKQGQGKTVEPGGCWSLVTNFLCTLFLICALGLAGCGGGGEGGGENDEIPTFQGTTQDLSTTNSSEFSTADHTTGDIAIVVEEGDPAPGLSPGTFFNRISSYEPVINAEGVVTFRASLRGGDTTSENDESIWIGKPDDLQLLVREGDPVPGTSEGIEFHTFMDGTLAITDSGKVAFGALVRGEGVTVDNRTGIWSGTPGSLRKLVRMGDEAPGLTDHLFQAWARYSNSNILPSFSDGGFVMQAYTLDSKRNQKQGIWWTPPGGELELVLSQGDPAPEIPGGFVDDIRSIPLVNQKSEIVFIATVDIGQVGLSPYYLFAGSPADLQVITSDGAKHEDLQANESLYLHASNIINNFHSFNNEKTVVFGAGINYPLTTQQSWTDRAIAIDIDRGNDSDSLIVVARENSEFPGTEEGILYDWFPYPALVNSTGELLYLARLQKGDDRIDGLFTGSPEQPELLTRSDTGAPGFPEASGSFTSYGINALSQVAFFTYKDSLPGYHLWTGTPGNIHLVGAYGTQFNAGEKGVKTIRSIHGNHSAFEYGSGNGDGRRSFFSDNGQAVFYATLHDPNTSIGTQTDAILISPATPEPLVTNVPIIIGMNEPEAERAIRETGLLVGAVTRESSNIVPAGDIISQNPAGGTQVFLNTPVDFVVSLGPAPIAVPNLKDMEQGEAEALILATDLNIGEVTTQYSDTVVEGSIIDQQPKAGELVERGSPVDLVISRGPAPITVPDLIGTEQDEAENQILEAGLEVGLISNVFSDMVPQGMIVAQQPAAGTSVEEGTPVDLVVSAGSAPLLIQVPALIGLPQTVAELQILEDTLTMGQITAEPSDTVPEGIVLSQQPESGTLVEEGTPVDIVISTGPASITVPDVQAMAQNEAETQILEAGLEIGQVTTAPSDTVPEGMVISQQPTPGSLVAEGATIDLVISTGRTSVLGDLNGDLRVDSLDASILFGSMRACTGDAGFVAEADYDADNCITFCDYRQWYTYYNAFLAQ
ncbi:DUF7453 family protein [Geoalkalibacter halelectricus]|uniref:DUF7453 family protein n=1 Tax=Geoalkalibacter halelectricus TaxID=2847045 RepID=UPI003D1E5315